MSIVRESLFGHLRSSENLRWRVRNAEFLISSLSCISDLPLLVLEFVLSCLLCIAPLKINCQGMDDEITHKYAANLSQLAAKVRALLGS